MIRLRELGEFQLIARIARAAACAGPRPGHVVVGIGDDGAVLRPRAGEDVVVSTDAFVEGVHFRWRSVAPETIGRRSLAAAASDLAAMGARPLGALLALEAPPELPAARATALARGVSLAGGAIDLPLVGGNVSRGPRTALVLTAVGAVSRGRALRRSGARPGDRLFVTGTLGGAALALARAERSEARLRHVPAPRLKAGVALARLPGVGACIDVSDGLLADLRHLLEASGVGAWVDASRIPRPPRLAAACARLGLDPMRLLLSGGEDYELLFSARRRVPRAAEISARLGVRVTEIGRVTERGLELRGAAGTRLSPRKEGWRHF